MKITQKSSTIVLLGLPSNLGALENDAAGHEETVSLEISQLLENPEDPESWDKSVTLFVSQFDHPYSSAFNNVIGSLNESDSKTFYRMALRGGDSSIFAVSLIRTAWKIMDVDISPYLDRWTSVPLLNESFPQDSIATFLITHILLAKSNYPLNNRYVNENDLRDKSLFAAAEIYYWSNIIGEDKEFYKKQSEAASKILFDTDNIYVIESIWQLNRALYSGIYEVFDNQTLTTIEMEFPEKLVAACRKALKDLNWQKDIFRIYPRNDEVNMHAISLLQNLGSVIDIDVLHPLIEDPLYGVSAVRAIKDLIQKS